RPALAVIDCADRPLGIRGAGGLEASPDRVVPSESVQRPRWQDGDDLLALVEELRQKRRLHAACKGRVGDRDIVSLRGGRSLEIIADLDANADLTSHTEPVKHVLSYSRFALEFSSETRVKLDHVYVDVIFAKPSAG